MLIDYDVTDGKIPVYIQIAFEKYVLALLKELARNENKTLISRFVDPEMRGEIRVYAPEGLDSTDESLAIEIFYTLPLDYRKMAALINRFHIDTKKILFITNNSTPIDSGDPQVSVWTRKDLDKLSDRFPATEFQFSSKEIPGLIDSNISEVLVRKTVFAYQNSNFNKNIGEHIKGLKQAFKSGNLVLFLGAGVSKSEKLPDWKELIEHLMTDFLKNDYDISDSFDLDSNEEFRYFSYIIMGRFIRKAQKNNFYKKIKEILYSNYKHTINPESLVNCIAQICRPVDRKGVRSVVTYNYDDILEFYLAELKIDHEIIFDKFTVASGLKLPIYHVHGYIPKESELKHRYQVQHLQNGQLYYTMDPLIFAEEDYHQQYGSTYSWQNLIQLNLLKENIVLFVGLGMNDPNLRRLLDISKEFSTDIKHYAILKNKWIFENEKLSNILRSIEENVFEELGINVIWYNNYSEINQIINEIQM